MNDFIWQTTSIVDAFVASVAIYINNWKNPPSSAHVFAYSISPIIRLKCK